MKLNLTRRRATAGIATLGLAAAAVAGTGLAFSSTSAAEGDPATFSALVLGVGDDETSRTLAWYSSTNPSGGEVVQLATNSSFTDATAVPATLSANITTEGLAVAAANGKAVLSGLKADTTYYYRVAEKTGGTPSTAYSFKTGEFGNSDFQFLFFGDPQIGAGNIATDGPGWLNTMNQTSVYSPKAELYVSGGDQIDSANNETQWNSFLAPDQLRSIPWAATIGNHDNGGRGYDQHFALPDTKDNSSILYSNNNNAGTIPGGDYWYRYKGVLFIDLNSNAYSATAGTGADPAHVAFVTSTINNHKGDADHVVLVYHHSIYSAASHTNDSENLAHRKDFTKTFSDLGVDLVLQGHDHSYSRSYALKSDTEGVEPTKADANEQPGQGTVVETKGGVVYVTANSASGSKYYTLGATTSSDLNGLMKNDTLVGGPQAYNASGAVKTRLAANSVENQEYVQTYIQVTVNERGLQVKNIRAGDNTTPNSGKLSDTTKGGVNGAGVYAPVGSVADQFDLFRNKADVSEIVPPADTRTIEVPGATTTVTAQPEPAPTVTVTAQPDPAATVTVTPAPLPATEVVPAALKQSVSDKITALTKKVKKAKGAKKAKLKAQLAAYKAVQSQLK